MKVLIDLDEGAGIVRVHTTFRKDHTRFRSGSSRECFREIRQTDLAYFPNASL